MPIPAKAMRQQIASAITAVVQVSRLADGKRKVMSVSEITGMEGEMITMQEIFVFQQTGVGLDGSVLGRFKATGVRPKFLDRIKAHGITLSNTMFDPNRTME